MSQEVATSARPDASATKQVVVVGAGMVGHRFAEELARRDLERTFKITVVGAEEYEPYNRILLSDVLAGKRQLSSLTLTTLPAEVTFMRGISAVGFDLATKKVSTSSGTSLSYDHLVLATGARASVPPIEGLLDKPRHVYVLRDLDDCRDLLARVGNTAHAVVLGGGVLGIEAACALRSRGVDVTVIDRSAYPMGRQLDAAAGNVLADSLADMGIGLRSEDSITEVLSRDGRVDQVQLASGEVLECDLLLISAGIRPNAEMAKEAGLEVDKGIIVDALMTTTDDQVHAIGDCAQTDEGVCGLLAPGWAQARSLVNTLMADGDPSPAHDEPGVTLKAQGIDLVTMGLRGSQASPSDRVLAVGDPTARRYLEIVVRGSRLAGATVVGAPDLLARLSVVYDRGLQTPLDPLMMLLPEKRTEEASPVRMPAGTVVCRCNSVTKANIVEAWESGARSVEDVSAHTRAGTGCGGCSNVLCGLVEWLESVDPDSPEQIQDVKKSKHEESSVKKSNPKVWS